jgi:hypothetical protein
MTTDSPGNGLSSKPAWAQTWDLWTVIIPRHSITGRLVYEKVLRSRSDPKALTRVRRHYEGYLDITGLERTNVELGGARLRNRMAGPCPRYRAQYLFGTE